MSAYYTAVSDITNGATTNTTTQPAALNAAIEDGFVGLEGAVGLPAESGATGFSINAAWSLDDIVLRKSEIASSPGDGLVTLFLSVENVTGANSTPGTLAAGFRPAAKTYIIGNCSALDNSATARVPIMVSISAAGLITIETAVGGLGYTTAAGDQITINAQFWTL